jgi:DNA-binding transcriptional MerR regulator
MEMNRIFKPTLDKPEEINKKTSNGMSVAYTGDQTTRRAKSADEIDGAVLTIGKVAKMAEVTADTVRYYEKEGLISPTQKSESGYRLYNYDAVRRLNFIKHAQQCGLSLAEIRELLELKNRSGSCCNDVRTVALHKKLQLEGKIKALQVMSSALSNLLDSCTDEEKTLEECPILSALETSRQGKDKK